MGGDITQRTETVMNKKQTDFNPKEFKRAIFFSRLKGMYNNVEELSFYSSDNDYSYILEAKR